MTGNLNMFIVGFLNVSEWGFFFFCVLLQMTGEVNGGLPGPHRMRSPTE